MVKQALTETDKQVLSNSYAYAGAAAALVVGTLGATEGVLELADAHKRGGSKDGDTGV